MLKIALALGFLVNTASATPCDDELLVADYVPAIRQAIQTVFSEQTTGFALLDAKEIFPPQWIEPAYQTAMREMEPTKSQDPSLDRIRILHRTFMDISTELFETTFKDRELRKGVDIIRNFAPIQDRNHTHPNFLNILCSLNGEGTYYFEAGEIKQVRPGQILFFLGDQASQVLQRRLPRGYHWSPPTNAAPFSNGPRFFSVSGFEIKDLVFAGDYLPQGIEVFEKDARSIGIRIVSGAPPPSEVNK